jgi:Rho-binding antiterminator
MIKPYQVINCDFHDVLEVAAMQRKTIVLDYVAADGAQKEITSQIVDVFAQAGADYLRLIDGELIRLDQIVAIDGLRLDRFPREV